MTEYLIKKGNHYASGLHIGVHFGITEQKYKVRFSKECLYTPDWENDWNKLCGWSYGLHHTNSIRACWRPSFTSGEWNKIELSLYVYENKIRKVLGGIIVEVEKEYEIELLLQQAWDTIPQRVFLSVKGILNGVVLDYSTKPSWGYRLFPYVGGDNVAVQDTRIYLEKL